MPQTRNPKCGPLGLEDPGSSLKQPCGNLSKKYGKYIDLGELQGRAGCVEGNISAE